MAVVAIDLWSTVREQDERAALFAKRDAERTARALRAALMDPSVLERLPPQALFAVEDGQLLVPDSVGWLVPAPPFDPERDLDVLARDRWLRATQSEGEAAEALWQSLRVDPTVDARAGAWLLACHAWHAHRAGDEARRDALLDELGAAAPLDASVSALLLYAAAYGVIPEWGGAALVRLPAAPADAVLRRLRERGVETVGLRRRQAAVAAHRAVLVRVLPRVPALVASAAPMAGALDGDLLLFFPARGRGALLNAAALEELIGALRRDGLEGSGALALGAASSSIEASPVVAGVVAITPLEVEASGVAAGPVGLAALAVALAVLCGGGAFLALRAVRREAQATRARADFLTTVTHELKTPLAGIRLVSELLEDDHVTGESERRAYLGRLSGEAVRLSMLIENVLDLGRLERGERPHDPRREDVVALAGETVRLFAPLAEREGVVVELRGEAAPVEAWVDRDTLRQALLNVLDNARKYAGAGARIDVSVEARPSGVAAVAVRDYGDGVPAGERDAVFERFRRGAAHRHGSVPGVGLGLHLARAIMRRHGGDLTCVEVPDGGRGACFELRLPLVGVVEKESVA